MDWEPSNTAPQGEVVMTKINNEGGVRNEQPLYRSGNLWWISDGSMYVYYAPTHWRPMTVEEVFDALRRMDKERDRLAAQHAKIKFHTGSK